MRDWNDMKYDLYFSVCLRNLSKQYVLMFLSLRVSESQSLYSFIESRFFLICFMQFSVRWRPMAESSAVSKGCGVRETE